MTLQRDAVIVIDLEATCWKKTPPPGQESEIIEIGVCLLDLKSLELSAKRGLLIKPTRSTVSEFCTKLTSLTQEQVDQGMTYAEACTILTNVYRGQARMWMSWGDYDRRMLRHQCQRSNVPYPLSDIHVNLKQLYADQRRKGKRCGMARALENEQLGMEGHHHRGHDDAWNTGRLLAKLLREDGLDMLKDHWDDTGEA